MDYSYQLLFSAGLFLTASLSGQINSNFPAAPPSLVTIDRSKQITREHYKLASDYVSNSVTSEIGHTYTGSKKGIDLWDNYTHIEITTDNTHIPENNVTALALDKNNHLWIGTKNSGIVIGVGKDIKPYKVRPLATHDKCVSSISIDKDGLMWVVYQNGGLECFKDCISHAYFPN